MSSQIKVETTLAQDSTINLSILGNPLFITIRSRNGGASEAEGNGGSSPSTLEEEVVAAEGDGGSFSSTLEEEVVAAEGDGKSFPSTLEEEVVTAIATRQLTGESNDSDVDVSMEGDNYLITFNPKVEQREDFTLAVFYGEDHIQGSPFLLRLVEPWALCSIHTEKKHVVMDAGEPINLIVPLEEGGEVSASVDAPFGSCAVETYHLPKNSVSANFMPKGVGAYSVHITLDDKEIENSPFLMLADFSGEEALDCRVLEEDSHFFNEPVRFRKEGICFRVSTEKAVTAKNYGELNVVCSGPGNTSVKIHKDPSKSGLELCEIIPSIPGNYRLSLLWKDQHISGSPFVVQFRKSIVEYKLDLHEQDYKLGVPHRFEIDCSDKTEGGALDVHSIPSTSADITIEAKDSSNGVYMCELLPKEIGEHIIIVKYNEKQIAGSPFVVSFKSAGNPLACRMIQNSRKYEKGGKSSIQVTTEGAGPGILEATAEDFSNSTYIPVHIKEVSEGGVYQLDFDPGQSVIACKLSVTYNKHHIHGSPFKLIFSDPGNFKIRGPGILGAQVGVWNNFVVQASNPHPGKLRVRVERDDGVQTKTEIASSQFGNRHAVRYSPKFPGKYKISARWGQIPIPGSPFLVYCSSSVYEVRDQPKKAYAGSPLEFKVHKVINSGIPEGKHFEVTARNSRNEIIKGRAALQDEKQHIYSCKVVPPKPGKYVVSTKWNHVHVKGSPFLLKVLIPPAPKRVHVYGPGVEDGLLEENTDRRFTVETEQAGGGILAIRVQSPGSSKDLKFNGVQDKENKRTVHVDYRPVVSGVYTVSVLWAGIQVPGSPFKIKFSDPSAKVEGVVVHPEKISVKMEEEWGEKEEKCSISLVDNSETYMNETRVVLVDPERRKSAGALEVTYNNDSKSHLSLCIGEDDDKYNGDARMFSLCDTRSTDSVVSSDFQDVIQMRVTGDSTDDEISINIEGDTPF